MRPIAAALLLALAPLAARAEPDAPAPAPPAWSLGAGVLAVRGSSLLFTPSATVLGAGQVSTLFAPQASLERRLDADTWLVLGVSGAVARQRIDLPAGAVAQSRADQAQLDVAAGVRRVLTPRGAPVEVSLVLTGDAGVGRSRQDTSGLADPVSRQTAWRVGATAGLAVDRELAANLSLRVATSLLGADYTWRRTEATANGTSTGSGFTAGLALGPSLELRLAF